MDKSFQQSLVYEGRYYCGLIAILLVTIALCGFSYGGTCIRWMVQNYPADTVDYCGTGMV